MTALYTKLDNFFNCCNVPLSIIDLNSNFLYERNLNKLSKDTLIDLNIVDKIAKNNINDNKDNINIIKNGNTFSTSLINAMSDFFFLGNY